MQPPRSGRPRAIAEPFAACAPAMRAQSRRCVRKQRALSAPPAPPGAPPPRRRPCACGGQTGSSRTASQTASRPRPTTAARGAFVVKRRARGVGSRYTVAAVAAGQHHKAPCHVNHGEPSNQPGGKDDGGHCEPPANTHAPLSHTAPAGCRPGPKTSARNSITTRLTSAAAPSKPWVPYFAPRIWGLM